MNGNFHRNAYKMPSSITAEQILFYGKRQSRSLQLDGNVIAYFGQIFQKSSSRVTVCGPVTAVPANRPLPK